MSGMQQLMSYVEIAPPDDLAEWIAALWCFRVREDAGEIEHRIPLTGALLLTVAPHAPLILTGPRVRPLTTIVRGGDVFCGAHFRPGAGRSFFELPPRSLRDEEGPARAWIDPEWCDAIVTSGDEALLLAELVSALSRRAASAARPDPVVLRAVDAIVRSKGTAPVGALAESSGLSERQFRRRFHDEVGVTAKELARLRRLRASAAEAVLREQVWSEVAAGGGFSDQAHLVREFRALLGTTPSRFGDHARRIGHRLVE